MWARVVTRGMGWQLGSSGATGRARRRRQVETAASPIKPSRLLRAFPSSIALPPTPRTRINHPESILLSSLAMDGGADAGAAAAGLDEADAAFFSRRRYRCCCFSAPWQSSSSSYARRAGPDEEWWHQVGEGGARGLAGGAERRRWWRRGVDAFMKVREWSELVAGPRWKTFIRRFRRGHHHRHGGAGGGRKLNYDALSYALNFDEGHGGPCSPGEDGGGGEYPDFSARFAAPPGSARASMDLGGRDAPSLFHHPPPQQPHPHTPPAIAAARG
uniref:Uncharacterized protein n=1 Tax=Avena sativa TaxID=4498 RepID=A0ACD5ZLF1_AVESA